MKARDPGRRETPGERVLKYRRPPRRRGRMGTSVNRRTRRVHRRREEIIRRADGVNVPREVQVHLLHGDHLRVPSARGAALDPERRPHGRLPDARHGGSLQVRAHRLREADRRRGLALAERRRIDARDDDVVSAAPPGRGIRLATRDALADFGFVASVRLVVVLGEPARGGDRLDRNRDRAEGRSVQSDDIGEEFKGVRSGVERRRGRGLKAGGGRRDATRKCLKDQRSPRERGRMGTSVWNAPLRDVDVRGDG